MENGTKVKISDTAFNGLDHLNGQAGKVAGKGQSGETIAVDLTSGGRCFVKEGDLINLEAESA